MSYFQSFGDDRKDHDVYETPDEYIDSLLDTALLPGGQWLEPTAGSGHIARRIRDRRPDVTIWANELRPECEESLRDACNGWHDKDRVQIGNVLHLEPPERLTLDRNLPWDGVVGNLPYVYPLVEDIIDHLWHLTPWMALLFRLDYAASFRRYRRFRWHCPDLYVIPYRRPFQGLTGSDNMSHAWFVLHTQIKRQEGIVKICEWKKGKKAPSTGVK